MKDNIVDDESPLNIEIIGNEVRINYVHSCNHCEKTFNTAHRLKQHLRSHRPKPAAICIYCNQLFNDNNILSEHIAKNHALVCDICGTGSYSKKRLIEHLSGDHGVTYECDLCEQAGLFISNAHLESHNADNHMFKCVLENCDSIFRDKPSLQSHVMEKHPMSTTRQIINQSKIHKCRYCNKEFKNISKLMSHIKLIHLVKESTHECYVCAQNFPSKPLCESHILSKHTFKCRTCLETFISMKLLNQHIRANHMENIRKYFKEKDTKVAAPRTNRSRGIHSLTSQTFQCKACLKTCNSQRTLNEHIREKHMEKAREYFREKDIAEAAPKTTNFQCKICLGKFASQKILNDHIKKYFTDVDSVEAAPKTTDSNDIDMIDVFQIEDSYESESKDGISLIDYDVIELENYRCDECSQVFESLQELEYHGKIHIEALKDTPSINHLEVKQYKCEECSESFESIDYLENHSKIHIVSVKEENNDLNIASTSASGTEAGEVVEHNFEYKCDECFQTFENTYDLECHGKVHIKRLDTELPEIKVEPKTEPDEIVFSFQ